MGVADSQLAVHNPLLGAIKSSQRLPTTPLRTQHARSTSATLAGTSCRHTTSSSPRALSWSTNKLGPKTGHRHPDFCCVLGTTLSLYYDEVVVPTRGKGKQPAAKRSKATE